MDLLNTLILHSKSKSSPLASIPLLGIAVDVVRHLKNVKDQSLKSVPENIKVRVFASFFRILHVDVWPKMSAGSELLPSIVQGDHKSPDLHAPKRIADIYLF